MNQYDKIETYGDDLLYCTIPLLTISFEAWELALLEYDKRQRERLPTAQGTEVV